MVSSHWLQGKVRQNAQWVVHNFKPVADFLFHAENRRWKDSEEAYKIEVKPDFNKKYHTIIHLVRYSHSGGWAPKFINLNVVKSQGFEFFTPTKEQEEQADETTENEHKQEYNKILIV